MQEVNPKQTSSRRNKHICYIILAVATAIIITFSTVKIIGWVKWRGLEKTPNYNDDSPKNGARLLKFKEAGPNLVLNVTNETVVRTDRASSWSLFGFSHSSRGKYRNCFQKSFLIMIKKPT